MYKRILVAVDLADPTLSIGSLDRAKELCDAAAGKIRLIYVAPDLIDAVSQYLPPNFLKNEALKTERWLKSQARDAGIQGEHVSVVARSGSVYDTILDESRTFGADLIVIGSHRPGLSTYLLGSNASRVVRHAKCSVLVIR